MQTNNKFEEELIIANKELAFQNEEKSKRAAELIIANKELLFQNEEKSKRAGELIIANKELAFQNEEKSKRAAELIIANKELLFQNEEKEKRAAELFIANKELAFQNEEKSKRAAELIIANNELLFQNEEKEKRARELIIALQNEKRTAELLISDNALIASETRYRRLFETAKDGILILDAETGKIVDVNPFLIDLLGYSKEQFVEKEIWEIGFFKDIVANQDKFLELQHNEYVRYEDLPLETAYGRQINVEFVSNVYLVNCHKVIQCNIRDITDRRKAEIELREKEVQYRNLADSGMALIWTSGKDKLCNYFNKPWLNFTGRTLEQELGNGWAEGVYSEDLDDCIETYVTAFDKHEKFDLEYRLRHVSGEYRWIQDLGTPNYNSKGEFVGYIGNCFDISERKQTEKELIIAKEKAEESDKLKTAFLQNMSHEIRTPLNGIIGFSGLLNAEDISKEDILEFTSMIKQSGKRLIEIVNNVLDISKIQTGQVNIENKAILINSIFLDLFNFFHPIATAKNISLKFHNSEDKHRTIYSDEAKLHQILTNLMNNAVKFTNSGNIDFGYEIKDDIIQLYVKDTGMGIPQELFEKIFERFIQAEHADTRNFEGAGLGLAICTGLVELLGGKIWVESEINKGTTFFFTLPYISASLPTKTDEVFLNNPVKLKKGKILIAEDDWMSYQYLSRILLLAGITVIHAENGEEAVECVRNIPDIDLILMDIRMPIMDGIEATKQIKKLRPELPIIAQTAYAFSDEKSKILSVGCDEYLAKPLDSDRLKAIINQYLK